MKPFLLVTTAALLILGELLAGSLGLALGLPLYGAVYFGVAYRRSAGLVMAGAAGLILDAVCFREYMVQIFLFPAIVAAVLPLVRRQRRQLPASALLAGAATGALTAAADALVAALLGGTAFGPDWVSTGVFLTVFGAVFMLLFTLTVDFFAAKCNLPRFRPVVNYPGSDDDE